MAAGEQCIYNMQQQLLGPCDFRLISPLERYMKYFNSDEQKAVGTDVMSHCYVNPRTSFLGTFLL